MDKKLREALKRYLVDLRGPILMGTSENQQQPGVSEPEARARREQLALDGLMRRRLSLVEGDKWETIVPYVAILAVAALGIAYALVAATRDAVIAALGLAMGAAFRLMQVSERAKYRRMIFIAIELSTRDQKGHTEQLVNRLLEGHKNPSSEKREQSAMRKLGS